MILVDFNSQVRLKPVSVMFLPTSPAAADYTLTLLFLAERGFSLVVIELIASWSFESLLKMDRERLLLLPVECTWQKLNEPFL